MTEAYYYSEPTQRLQVLLDEVTRAKPGAPETRFVQLDDGTVDRLASRFHHALFGRRGTGKSSLLRRIEADLKADGHLVAWADQETFMGLSYPDVLVSTLAEVFRQYAAQLRLQEPSKRRWFQFRATKGPKVRLAVRLEAAVAELLDLKRQPDQSQVERTTTYATETTTTAANDLSARAAARGFDAGGGRKRSRSSKNTQGQGVAQTYRTDKSEHLERGVIQYRALMTDVAQVAPDAFIVLDDFYRLAPAVQPRIAGYFHRVVKDTNVWLKIGSIDYWTRLYAGGPPAIGIQAPHDHRELSLDRGLLDFKSSKRFLERILTSLADESKIDVGKLFSPGALDRLVLASGGVPRDYIGLVGEAVTVARNRGPSAKPGTERVIAEDVDAAAGRTVDTKFNDMAEDTGAESADLRSLVIQLTNHCRQVSSACFLINAGDDALVRDIKRLQNMRFVHSIATNETLPNQQSDRYHVYLLDVSQLAAQRAWQVDFMGWTKREGRRARRLVFSPDLSGPPIPVPPEDDPPALDDELAVVGDIDAGQQ